MQVHVTAPPERGYWAMQAKLRWTNAILDYLPAAIQAGEALWPECDVVARLDGQPEEPSMLFGCVPFPALNLGDTFTGAVLQFQFRCQEDGNTPLDLVPGPGDPQGGTFLVDDYSQMIDPLIRNATVTCAAPTPTPTDTPMPTLTPISPTPHGSHSSVAGITLPQTGAGSAGSGGAGLLTWLAAGAAAGALAFGGAAWYARRRLR